MLWTCPSAKSNDTQRSSSPRGEGRVRDGWGQGCHAPLTPGPSLYLCITANLLKAPQKHYFIRQSLPKMFNFSPWIRPASHLVPDLLSLSSCHPITLPPFSTSVILESYHKVMQKSVQTQLLLWRLTMNLSKSSKSLCPEHWRRKAHQFISWTLTR